MCGRFGALGCLWQRGRSGIGRTNVRGFGVGDRIGLEASDDYRVTCVVADSASLGENLDQGDLTIRLINHGMRYGTDDSDGLAFAILHRDADVWVRDKAIGFEDFRDFTLGLNFG